MVRKKISGLIQVRGGVRTWDTFLAGSSLFFPKNTFDITTGLYLAHIYIP